MDKFSNLNFNEKTILITGGAGFIGSNLAFYFQRHYPKSTIIVFDCFRSDERFANGNLKSFGHYKNLIGFYGKVICGNINNKEDLEILNDLEIDYIFHHAAISDTRVYDQEIVFKTNLNSFDTFLTLAKKNQATLVYASSASVYGNLNSPQKIGVENPENPYAYSKYAMDIAAKEFIEENPDIRVVGLRFFNVYGNREFYKGKTASMVIQLGHQLLDGERPKLFVRSDEIFRDFVHIDDVIQANIKACNSTLSGAFNVGSGNARSFQDVLNILKSNLNVDTLTQYIENPYDGYQFHTEADISLSDKNFNYQPKISLEKGIKSYVPEIIDFHGKSSL